MKIVKIFFFLCLGTLSFAGLEEHYKKVPKTAACKAPRNIDFIYLINLDQRPERWIQSLAQLGPYGIIPQRFPAIYGWTLTPKELDGIGLQFQPGMWTGRESVMHFPPEKGGDPIFVNLDASCVGKAYFSGWTVKGTIGCSLSHLSVLKDAYDSDYGTVWVLEDDMVIKDDPHKLSDLIDELDALVGPEGWDVLYTDRDYLIIDENQDLENQKAIVLMWRPDMPYRDPYFLVDHEDLGENFIKIGSRMRAHSIIYRRCGLKKIVEFYRDHGNFLPYDQEIALIPDIQLFVLKKEVVSVHEVDSDTRARHFPR